MKIHCGPSEPEFGAKACPSESQYSGPKIKQVSIEFTPLPTNFKVAGLGSDFPWVTIPSPPKYRVHMPFIVNFFFFFENQWYGEDDLSRK